MAQFNPKAFKPIDIDGEQRFAPQFSTLEDILPAEVNAVTVYEPNGKSELIPRSQFNRPLPAGFTTHLTHVEKGCGAIENQPSADR